jgi:hypothetical protein
MRVKKIGKALCIVIWVQSKISKAKKQCDEAIRMVTDIRNRLLCM